MGLPRGGRREGRPGQGMEPSFLTKDRIGRSTDFSFWLRLQYDPAL